jgi:uncharacterized protein (UPF0333 family)
MSEIQDAVKSAVKISKKGIRLSWWLIVLAVVVFGGLMIFFQFINAEKKADALKAQPDTAEEIKIKQNLSSMRGDIIRYFDTKKTFVGWAPTKTVQDLVKGIGSEIKVETDKTTYRISAEMPSSKQIFCMDNSGTSGFAGEVEKVSSKKATCN